MMNPRLSTLICTVALIGAGCGAGVTPAPTATPAPPSPTASPPPTVTAAPTPRPAPTYTPAPDATIGVAADDGARIINVERNPLSGTIDTTRARDITIDSPAVGRVVQVQILLPAKFDAQPDARWPVLFVLPGSSGGHLDWTNWSDLDTITAKADLLVVIPDAGSDDPGGSSYTNWWNDGKGGSRQWETFHLVELPQLLERNWHAGTKRAIAGVSAGGYGAMEYASRRPGMFVFAAAYSGVFDPLGHTTFWGAPPNVWGSPKEHPDIWAAHDPYLNAAALKGTGLFVSYGNGEPGALDDYAVSPYDPDGSVEREVAAESAAFVQRLTELGIPVTEYAYGNGTHNGPYVERALHKSLPLILTALGL